MASFAKIWTTIFSDPDFLALPLNARGLYLQMVVKCKDQADDGRYFSRNITAMGQDFGCEKRTASKNLVKLVENNLGAYVISDNGVVEVILLKYKEYQEIDTKGFNKVNGKIPVKLPPIRPDHTIPNKIRPEPTISEAKGEPIKHYKLTVKAYEKYKRLYPKIDHELELIKADDWVDEKPEKRTPTERGVSRFIGNWFKNATDYSPLPATTFEGVRKV